MTGCDIRKSEMWPHVKESDALHVHTLLLCARGPRTLTAVRACTLLLREGKPPAPVRWFYDTRLHVA
jgi:hypothetical protein